MGAGAKVESEIEWKSMVSKGNVNVLEQKMVYDVKEGIVGAKMGLEVWVWIGGAGRWFGEGVLAGGVGRWCWQVVLAGGVGRCRARAGLAGDVGGCFKYAADAAALKISVMLRRSIMILASPHSNNVYPYTVTADVLPLAHFTSLTFSTS